MQKLPLRITASTRAKHIWSWSVRAGTALAIVAASALILRGSEAEHRAQLSTDLLAFEARGTTRHARVILPGTPAETSTIAGRHQLPILRTLQNSAVLSVTSAQLTELAADPDVEHLSGDLLITPAMSVSNKATYADKVRAGQTGLLGIASIPGVNGSGIRVAVVDSGITPHPALTNKIVANVSFVTGDPSTLDAYGHGTHVAGIIAGSNTGVTSLYNGGIAPGAQLVNVRVLGPKGSGLTSDVIAGMEWVIANRSKYNIRIANLSLGHPVTEPSLLDPLGAVVTRAVLSGVVVVVAAGNSGTNPETGQVILGGINSPANAPLAVTVGATNTWNTAARSDDTITTYSSRGPTKYEMFVKPDVAAPGNKIISLEAKGSLLASTYPYLHKAGVPGNAYMQLSGTSMAAPMVSGAAALLLSGNPGLLPLQVKVALLGGATYMSDAGLLGAGTGNADFWSSRKISAGLGLLNLSLVNSLLSPIVNSPLGVTVFDLGPSANELLYGPIGSVAGGDAILWGTQLFDPSGAAILWGTSDDGDAILWGTSDDGDAILWGTSDDGDAILWGTTHDPSTQPDPR